MIDELYRSYPDTLTESSTLLKAGCHMKWNFGTWSLGQPCKPCTLQQVLMCPQSSRLTGAFYILCMEYVLLKASLYRVSRVSTHRWVVSCSLSESQVYLMLQKQSIEPEIRKLRQFRDTPTTSLLRSGREYPLGAL